MEETTTKDYKAAPFVALAPNYWGRGFTVEEAKANLKRQGGRLTQYAVYRMPVGAEQAQVDGLGRLSWTWQPGSDTSGQPEVVASRGVPL